MTLGENAAVGAGHDARWPIRAFAVARLLAVGPHRRIDLARLAESVCGLRRTLVEDVLCAMENDGIVTAAPVPHLTVAERRLLILNARSAADRRLGLAAMTGALRLTPKGRRFVLTHKQEAEAGSCGCCWCVELAEVRAWVAEQPPDFTDQVRIRAQGLCYASAWTRSS